jgi:hypothetical protein
MHGGCNAFFFQAPDSDINIQGLLRVLAESLESHAPTRFVLCIPKQEAIPTRFMEISTLDPGCPIFSYDYSTASKVAPYQMSILLGCNKESMTIDPIDWENFLDQVRGWSQNWPHDYLKIPPETDALFRERIQLPHSPRALSKQPLNVSLKSIISLNFYDAFGPKTPMRLKSIPSHAAELIRKANQQPCFLSVLGILPNQLRTLLKESGHESREECLLDISRTLFFSGFKIWSQRQRKNSLYWKEIAPENRKVQSSIRKKHKGKDLSSQSNCKNPFHFLVRHCNLSKQRPTKCPCRNLPFKSTHYKMQSITKFIFKFPENVHYDNSRPCAKLSSSPNYTLISSSPRNNKYSTRGEAIRKQHDRGKKRKRFSS